MKLNRLSVRKYVDCRGRFEELNEYQPQQGEDGKEMGVGIHACCGRPIQTAVIALVQFNCAQCS
jgi:hypothetical protein